MPLDYRYLVYAMLKTECRGDLTARGWQLLPMRGRERGDLLHFHRDDGLHALRVRLPLEDLGHLRKIEHTIVRVSQHLLALGEVVVRDIRPHPVVHSEIVVVTSDSDTRGVRGEEFGFHVGKRLGVMLGHLNFGVEIGKRTRMHVHGQRLFGHPVTVKSLTNEESLLLLHEGLGESRAMGAGVFEPCH